MQCFTANFPEGVKHRHGATPDSRFSHIAIEIPGKDISNERLEPANEKQYVNLN